MIDVGNFVTRKSHNHDIIFKVIEINEKVAILEGYIKRLMADSNIDDLVCIDKNALEEIEKKAMKRVDGVTKLSRFKMHLPGKILHIDGDKFYLDKCLALYNELGLPAYGIYMSEKDIKKHILDFIDEINPDVIILTGHDSYNKKGIKDINNYRNTYDYVEAVKLVRKHYSKDHIFIFAGACQSNFEALIAAGANFASSPKRVNIDAFDPAIVAIKAATTSFTDIIAIDDIKDLLDSKKDGISGIESYGKLRLFV